VKYIIDNQVVLSRAPEGSFAAHLGLFARSPSEQRIPWARFSNRLPAFLNSL
jgi:hypothetical protein